MLVSRGMFVRRDILGGVTVTLRKGLLVGCRHLMEHDLPCSIDGLVWYTS